MENFFKELRAIDLMTKAIFSGSGFSRRESLAMSRAPVGNFAIGK
jgi:hypothetical protein